MKRQWRTCICTSVNLVSASSPDKASQHSNRSWPRIERLLIYKVPYVTPFIFPVVSIIVKDKPKKNVTKRQLEFEADDDLEPGDRVQIRSEKEIQSTLGKENKFKGLSVMPEMSKFYGKEYRVFKKLKKMMIESTGELRVIKSPTYLLEGVFCDGEFHQNCDRTCFLLWKREWLKKL
jgi:hypothetical protein